MSKLLYLCTPALIHDGLKYEDWYFFTSIDGNIIIANNTENDKTTREWHENLNHYNRDLETRVIRMEEKNYGREPKLCRSIEIRGKKLM